MTTANCGAPDGGIGTTSPNGNAGSVVPAASADKVGLLAQPVAGNGNSGSVIPSINSQPTVPGGSLVTPPLPTPQVTAIVLAQEGISSIILVGN